MGYLDDIIIYSRSEKEHLEHLERNIHQTKSSRTQTQTREMLFLQKTHTVPWTFNISRRKPASPREIGKHSQNASTKESKGSETVSRTSRLLQKICTQICRYLKGVDTSNEKRRRIQVDP